MKKSALKIILFTLLIQSCNISETRTNNEDDIKKGREFVSKFYDLIKNGNREKAVSLFGGNLTESDAKETFKKVDMYLGDLLTYKEEFGHSLIENINGQINERYEFQYDVSYTKGKAIEKIILTSVNGELKINGYNPIMQLP
jgi:hypothetical protein